MKYGLLVYNKTDNIGDYIQSYAGIRFLPSIDYYVEREALDCFVPEKKEYVATIMNGWYLHNKGAFPPSPYIYPHLISMHFSNYEENHIDYLSGYLKDYFEKYGKVGVRDEFTKKTFEKKEIECYFSGCMTLTINKFDDIKKEDYICAVDVKEEIIDKIRSKTKKEIRIITHNTDEQFINLSNEEKIEKTKELLKVYQAASCVVTTRLHCALPCLALETPVLLVDYEFNNDRLGTFLKLLHYSTEKEILSDKLEFDFNNPPKNKEDYKEMREKLEKSCYSFIEETKKKILNEEELPDVDKYKKYYSDRISWMRNKYEDYIKYQRKKLTDNYYRIKELDKYIKDSNKNYQFEINKRCNENEKLYKEIQDIKNSKTWELAQKLKKFVKD